MKYEKIEEMYESILKIVAKYEGEKHIDLDELKRKSKDIIYKQKILDLYEIDIDNLKDGMYVRKWCEGDEISWNDSKNKPEVGEILFSIRFPTGAYIFGDYYPKELFNDFFNELKDYKPDYSDSMNHCLYFKIENAREIFKNYNNVLKKYRELSVEEHKKHKIKKLKKELEELK